MLYALSVGFGPSVIQQIRAYHEDQIQQNVHTTGTKSNRKCIPWGPKSLGTKSIKISKPHPTGTKFTIYSKVYYELSLASKKNRKKKN